MDTFLDLQTTVQNDMTITGSSNLYSPDKVKSAVNRAYRRIGALYLWPGTEDAVTTGTDANIEYYDDPENWCPDSIWKLKVDGTDYGDPMNFADFLYEKENNFPSGKTKAWATNWDRFHIYPTPTANGMNNIEIHGQKVVNELVLDDDETIFSHRMPDVNDAIAKEAVAILVAAPGQELKDGQLISAEAKILATIAWNKIRGRQAKYRKTRPGFVVPDYYARGASGSRSSRREPSGNF